MTVISTANTNASTDNQDTITIRALEITTIIGTYAFERRLAQKLFVTLSFPVNARSIAQQDDINMPSIIDYEKVSASIVNFGLENQFFLLETFAEKLAHYLFSLYPLISISLNIRKAAALKHAQGVEINICRIYPNPA